MKVTIVENASMNRLLAGGEYSCARLYFSAREAAWKHLEEYGCKFTGYCDLGMDEFWTSACGMSIRVWDVKTVD